MVNAQGFWCGSPVTVSVGALNPQRSQGICIMKITTDNSVY